MILKGELWNHIIYKYINKYCVCEWCLSRRIKCLQFRLICSFISFFHSWLFSVDYFRTLFLMSRRRTISPFWEPRVGPLPTRSWKWALIAKHLSVNIPLIFISIINIIAGSWGHNLHGAFKSENFSSVYHISIMSKTM